MELAVFKLVLDDVERDPSLRRADIRNDLVLWILPDHFVAICVKEVSRVIRVLPLGDESSNGCDHRVHLMGNRSDAAKSSIQEKEVYSTDSTKM